MKTMKKNAREHNINKVIVYCQELMDYILAMKRH